MKTDRLTDKQTDRQTHIYKRKKKSFMKKI